MTVALGYGRLRIFTHVFAVGKKAISIGTNRIPGDFANPRTGSSSVPQTNCKMWPRVMFTDPITLRPAETSLMYLMKALYTSF